MDFNRVLQAYIKICYPYFLWQRDGQLRASEPFIVPSNPFTDPKLPSQMYHQNSIKNYPNSNCAMFA